MQTIGFLAIVLVIYFLMQLVILPKFGIST